MIHPYLLAPSSRALSNRRKGSRWKAAKCSASTRSSVQKLYLFGRKNTCFFSSAFLPCFKCDTGLPNAGKFSSTGKLLKLWTYCRELDLFVHILLQNLIKRGRSEVIAVWKRVNFMPPEQLRILQASR